MPISGPSAASWATNAGSRRRAGARIGSPSLPARSPTGVGVTTAPRPTGRGGAVTTATSVSSGAATSTSRTGTAKAPEPKKIARAGSAAGCRLGPLRVDPALLERRVRGPVLLVVHPAASDGDQLVRRREVVHVELPLQVVQLVLERPPQEARSGDLELPADAVLGNHPDLLLPRHVRHVARDREASLEIAVLAVLAHDPRVHELEQPILDLHDGDVQRLAELRRREADARRVAHRVDQVIDQPVEELVEGFHRLAAEPEPRVAEREDGQDTHGASIREA